MAENQKTIEELKAELAALQAAKAKAEDEKAKAEAEKAALLNSNTELQQQLEESQQTVEQVMVIVSDGKNKYKLLAPQFQLEGKVYTAEDLKKDKEAVKKLVERKSGLIVKI